MSDEAIRRRDGIGFRRLPPDDRRCEAIVTHPRSKNVGQRCSGWTAKGTKLCALHLGLGELARKRHAETARTLEDIPEHDAEARESFRTHQAAVLEREATEAAQAAERAAEARARAEAMPPLTPGHRAAGLTWVRRYALKVVGYGDAAVVVDADPPADQRDLWHLDHDSGRWWRWLLVDAEEELERQRSIFLTEKLDESKYAQEVRVHVADNGDLILQAPDGRRARARNDRELLELFDELPEVEVVEKPDPRDRVAFSRYVNEKRRQQRRAFEASIPGHA